MIHTYVRHEEGMQPVTDHVTWHVGIWEPIGEQNEMLWRTIRVFDTEYRAAYFVNMLNGGQPYFPDDEKVVYEEGHQHE